MSDEPNKNDDTQDSQGVLSGISGWVRTNWNEETNLGKAKVAGIGLLVYLFVLTLVPGEKTDVPEQADVVAQSGVLDEVQEADETLGSAAEQASEAYDSYAARVTELEVEKRAEQAQATEQVVKAYESYEARIGELEKEKKELTEKTELAPALDDAANQASEAYDGYEARISDLQKEKSEEVEEAAKQASEAYEGYEARIGELEQEKKVELSEAAEEVVDIYASYEARIAELEGENKVLTNRIAELEQAQVNADSSKPSPDAETLKKQLQLLKAALESVVQQLEPAGQE